MAWAKISPQFIGQSSFTSPLLYNLNVFTKQRTVLARSKIDKIRVQKLDNFVLGEVQILQSDGAFAPVQATALYTMTRIQY